MKTRTLRALKKPCLQTILSLSTSKHNVEWTGMGGSRCTLMNLINTALAAVNYNINRPIKTTNNFNNPQENDRKLESETCFTAASDAERTECLRGWRKFTHVGEEEQKRSTCDKPAAGRRLNSQVSNTMLNISGTCYRSGDSSRGFRRPGTMFR